MALDFVSVFGGAVAGQAIAFLVGARRARLEAAFAGLTGVHSDIRTAVSRATTMGHASQDKRPEYVLRANDAVDDAIAGIAAAEAIMPARSRVIVLGQKTVLEISDAIRFMEEQGDDADPKISLAPSWQSYDAFTTALRVARRNVRLASVLVPRTTVRSEDGTKVRDPDEVQLLKAEGYDQS